MGLKTKKGLKGTSAKHLTRASALRKLQVSLADFRRLCILKGVYPRDPKRKLHGKDKTYYHAKDILYLYHEPLLQKLREIRAYERKYRRVIGRQEKMAARSLQKHRPVYGLFHIVKERYPTLLDAVRDMDDALSTIALFTTLSQNDEASISAKVLAEATRLFDEFMFFCAEKRLVRKVFCSIKGFYIQVKYLGQPITFLLPHLLPQQPTAEVDFSVLLTFLEFYCCLLKTVNFKVFSMEQWVYPPAADAAMVRAGCRFLSLSVTPAAGPVTDNCVQSTVANYASPTVLQSKIDALQAEQQLVVEDEDADAGSVQTTTENDNASDDENADNHESLANEEDEASNSQDFEDDQMLKRLHDVSSEEKKIQSLFSGFSFFISREVPRTVLAFLLKSCGASLVAWEGECSPAAMSDSRITHQLVDRPLNDTLKEYQNTRELIQPQWVFDSINAGACLPVAPYSPGTPLPPHLSPFTEDLKNYVPEQRFSLDTWRRAADEEKENLVEEASESDEEHAGENVDDVELHEQFHQEELRREKCGSHTPEAGATAEKVRSPKSSKKRIRDAEKEAERELRKALLSKKHKRLLDKIEFGKNRQLEAAVKLEEKRAAVHQKKNKVV